MQSGPPQRPALLRLLARSPRHDPHLPPAILLSGGNAVSIARSLSRQGVAVYGMHRPEERLRFSRHSTWIPVPIQGSVEGSWTRYLLGPESEWLRGAVLLTCGDPGIEILIKNRAALTQKFRLDEANPQAQRMMLDKLSTYLQAKAAGVPTPLFWRVGSLDDIHKVRDELTYPLIVKPLLSHVFTERFGKKLLVISDFRQLLDAYRPVADSGLEVMLVEMIPGGDDRLCSYYTYLDAQGNALFDFTKRVIRRCPILMGNGCYHVTDWIPELKDLSLRLFRQAGLRGLANAEFKFDERDGQMKLIECNARFTAANMLVEESGYDLPRLVYDRIVGRPPHAMGKYKLGKRLWYPVDDFHSYKQMRAQGMLTTRDWVRSILKPAMLPFYRWDDPLPSIVYEFTRARDSARRLFHRFLRLFERSPKSPLPILSSKPHSAEKARRAPDREDSRPLPVSETAAS